LYKVIGVLGHDFENSTRPTKLLIVLASSPPFLDVVLKYPSAQKPHHLALDCLFSKRDTGSSRQQEEKRISHEGKASDLVAARTYLYLLYWRQLLFGGFLLQGERKVHYCTTVLYTASSSVEDEMKSNAVLFTH